MFPKPENQSSSGTCSMPCSIIGASTKNPGASCLVGLLSIILGTWFLSMSLILQNMLELIATLPQEQDGTGAVEACHLSQDIYIWNLWKLKQNKIATNRQRLKHLRCGWPTHHLPAPRTEQLIRRPVSSEPWVPVPEQARRGAVSGTTGYRCQSNTRAVVVCAVCTWKDAPVTLDSCPTPGSVCFLSEATFENPWEHHHPL